MSTARTHIRNLSFNLGGHAATLLVMFFLTPYIVGKLDAVSYGIWSLLNVLTGYMGIFDLGVRASVGRHISLYLGRGDQKGVDETVRAGLGFFSLTAILIFLMGLILGWIFPQVFRGVPPEHYNTVRLLLPFMVINIWLSAPAAIFSSTLTAYERFDIVRAVDMVVLAVRTFGTILALHLGWDLWGLAGTVLLGNITAVIGNYICSKRQNPNLRSWPFLYSKKRLQELINYGFFAFISAVAVKVIGQTDLVIAGAALGVASVREYSIGSALVTYSATFMALISRTLFPALQKTIARGQIGDAIFFYGRQLRLTLCFAIPVYIGMSVYSKEFIRLWMFQEGFGEDAVFTSARVLMILSVSALPIAFIRPSISFLASLGCVKFTALISIFEAAINLALSLIFVFVFQWGLAGIALGTLVARVLISSLWIPWYQNKKVGKRTLKMQLNVFIRVLLSGSLFAGICIFLNNVWEPRNWLSFFIVVAASILTWIVIGGTIMVPYDFRIKVFSSIKTYIKAKYAKMHSSS